MLTSKKANDLFKSQLKDWDQAQANYEALKSAESKEFVYTGFSMRVQCNSARIQSSVAKVDAKSISERKCFLCLDNLPTMQKGIAFGDNYHVLVNPFPIFPKHFTIPTHKHVDQLILNRYEDMLDLAKALDEFVIFYNGPKCGASAPDHAHFQAGNKGFLPIEKDIKTMPKRKVEEKEGIKIYAIEDKLRNFFLIETKDTQLGIQFFKHLYSLLPIHEGEQEPMMNVITWYEKGIWYSCIFPRILHRPSYYSAEGEDNILISPGAVDLGGVLITPLEKDYRKIQQQEIDMILKEVCISEAMLEELLVKLKSKE